MVTLTTADNALKTLYLGVISEQLNTNTNPLLNKIAQSTTDILGRKVSKLAPFGINGGIGAGDEDGTLPSSAQNKYVVFESTLKNLFGTIELSDKAVLASSGTAGAFVNLLNAEMEGLIRASAFNFGRMLYGDGSGKLTAVSAYSNGAFTASSIKNIIEGMVIDFYETSSGTSAIMNSYKTLRITAIDRANSTFSVDKTITANDFDFTNKTYFITVQNSYEKEITGLDAIFGQGNLYGVTRSSNAWMNPLSTAIGQNESFGDVKIQSVIDQLSEYYDSNVDFLVGSAGVKRAYQDYLNTYRSNVDVMELAGGYKALSYNGIPLISDKFAPASKLFCLNTSEFTLHQLCDWRWLEGEDGKVLKQVANKPVYTATLVKYAELICDKPGGQGVITSITEK